MTNYRIEIDLAVEDKDESTILEAAKRIYLSGTLAWAEEYGNRVPVSAEDFIPDIESALLELFDANLQSAVPNMDTVALKCIAISRKFNNASDQLGNDR